MRLRKSLIFFILLFTTLPFVPARVVSAQGPPDPATPACRNLVDRLLDDAGTLCSNLVAGDVCYGSDEVEALPISGILPGDVFPSGEFDDPGDRIPVTQVARVSTSELDFSGRSWGVAFAKIDAYIGMDEATDEPLTAELLYVVPGGVEIEAARAPLLDANGDPILDDLNPAPMQEIYLRNSLEPQVCDEVAIPPFLLLQSEPGQTIDLVVNEEPIRLNGTAIVEILDDDTMRVTTLSGLTTLNAESPDPRRIPPGFFADICLLVPDDLGLDGESNDQPVGGDCDPTPAQPMTQAQLDRLEPLEGILENVLFEEIVIPAIVVASGVGEPEQRFTFSNTQVLQVATEACANGLLPQEACTRLQLAYTPSVCPQIIDPALVGLGNCFNTGTGLACYGNTLVEGLPRPDLTEFSSDFFVPGDTVATEELARIIASNLDRAAQSWGLSVINVNAVVEANGGQPDTALLRYILPGGVTLEASTFLSAEDLAPLQEAYLRLNRQDPLCDAAIPPVLIVESEPGESIDFYMNEALIRLEGTVLLDLISAGDTGQMLRLMTVAGTATVNPNGTAPQVVETGFQSSICLDPAEDRGLDPDANDRPMGACDWTAPQPLTRAGLDRLETLDALSLP